MNQTRQWQAGFTLIELVIVMVVIGIISAYVIVLNANTAALTARSQADKLASDIRHAQALATTWGRGLKLVVDTTANSYKFTCTSGTGAAPCIDATSAVTDPATNEPFSFTLSNSATFSAAPSTSISFDSAGVPSAGGSYQIYGGGSRFSAVVAPTTGTVSVTSP